MKIRYLKKIVCLNFLIVFALNANAEVSYKCLKTLNSIILKLDTDEKIKEDIPVECQYYRISELSIETQNQLKQHLKMPQEETKISEMMGKIIIKKNSANSEKGSLSDTVADRISIKEAVEANVTGITEEQYALISCAKYTHIEAVFWRDHSKNPKFTGTVSRKTGEIWESANVSSLNCGQSKKSKPLVHPDVLQYLPAD